ncbi:hypothetical protein KIPB_012721, partial [Kipferlia bialata]|eukprot:g12721.t1
MVVAEVIDASKRIKDAKNGTSDMKSRLAEITALMSDPTTAERRVSLCQEAMAMGDGAEGTKTFFSRRARVLMCENLIMCGRFRESSEIAESLLAEVKLLDMKSM